VAGQETKKERERSVFRRFCQVASLDPTAFVHDDSPDFVLPDGSHGVELTAYHRDVHGAEDAGSPTRVLEGTLEGLLREAQAQFCQDRYDVLLFPRMWPSPSLPTRQDRVTFLQELLDLVGHGAQEVVPSAASVLSQYAERVEVWPTPSYQGEPLWQVVAAAVMEVNILALGRIIEKKNARVEAYRSRAGPLCQLWLLIHSSPMPCVGLPERGRPSTCGWITDELRAASFETSFDRVYYFDGDKEETARLTVRRGKVSRT
jgi:hypothetical protein